MKRRRGLRSEKHVTNRSLYAMEAMIADGKITRGASCTAKTAYTAGGAVAARRAMKRKRKSVAIYHCRFCGGYHLTRVGA